MLDSKDIKKMGKNPKTIPFLSLIFDIKRSKQYL